MKPLHSPFPVGTPETKSRLKSVPASSVQKQLWALLQKFPDRPLGNFPVALNIDGPLDPALLTRALNDVVMRHDILRTSFESAQGRLTQLVAPTLNIPVPVIDLRLLAPGVREAQAFRLAREDASRAFDARRLPLMRAQLFLFEQTRHILVLTLHRNIIDQESLGILLRELVVCYEARRQGTSPELPPLPRQYADYAATAPDPSAQATALAWWTEKFAGEAPPLHLPADRSRSGTREDNGRVEKLDLSATLRSSVDILAHREGTNPFTILLAAFQVLLHRYTSLTDFVMGIVVSDRHLPDTENLLGPCSRVMPSRPDLSGDPSFRELLERVRRELLDTYTHTARLPFDNLPGRFHNPALSCPVQFVHERREVELTGWPDFRVQELELDSGVCACELSFHLVESAGRWSIRAEYDSASFSPTVVQQLLAHFNVLLQAAVSQPRARLSELPLLTSIERRRLLNEWNNTLVPYPRDATVHELIGTGSTAESDEPAVACAGRQLTYRELDQRSNQLGRHLRAAGIRPGRLVGLCMDRSPELLVALQGILKAGGAVCLLDPASLLPPALIESARLNLILTQSPYRRHFLSGETRVLLLDTEAADINRADASTLATVAGPDDFCWLAWTAGATGQPQPVEYSHRAIVSMLYARRRLSGLTATDVVFGVAPLRSIEAAIESLLPLAFGARLELASADELADPARWAARMTACNPTLMQASPSQWIRLISAGWPGAKSLRAFSAGAPLSRELADRLLPRCRELWNLYGTTETGGGCLTAPVGPGQVKPLIGRPFANAQIHVLDARLQPVPVGITGEIYVGGETLASGYRENPAGTIARFPADPFRRTPGARLFRTGDLARRLPNGEIDFLGRIEQRNPSASKVHQRAPGDSAVPARNSEPTNPTSDPAPLSLPLRVTVTSNAT